MSDATKTYIADSQLAALLRTAAESGQRLKVVAEGRTFEVEVMSEVTRRDIWQGYDPEAAINAWESLRGSLKDVDPEELVQQFKRDRE